MAICPGKTMNFNPIVLSIPIFFLLIGIELLVDRFTHRHLYGLPDTLANLSCGITQQLSGLFLTFFALGAYQYLYEYAALLAPSPGSWWYWLALYLLIDVAYYWAHRMSHEINLFWGGHMVHHQSEEYNLSVALRQSSLQTIWTFAFSLPIALLGFRTVDFALVSAFNTLYQFWIHTETIRKLPRWVEFIFNTPSHHRVHHGRNPKYIDKNHAGSLIIWDRLFGTFQAEEEAPVYGVTKPLRSWNALFANVAHYADMRDDLRQIQRWTDRLRYLFKKPGWLPESLGGYRAAPEVDVNNYRKYQTSASAALSYYVLFQYIICLTATAFFLFRAGEFSLAGKSLISVLICFTVVNCGVLFEQRPWVQAAEWLRIIALPAILAAATFMGQGPSILYFVAAAYGLVSVCWFSLVRKKQLHAQPV